ncbi:glycoside hydrolase family 95 protein [Pendulispora rubella]|uniref:Glycoside hydrolase family 95 protein n=1 Tax=Pendulispora rubella TaxID=2741070 RepID=A0ABZ2KV31_9BACT
MRKLDSQSRLSRLSRRAILRGSGALGLTTMLGGLRPFTAAAATIERPSKEESTAVAEANATTLWYPAPADEALVVQQGLPVGNGRLGALVGGDPDTDFLYLTDGSLWMGDANDTLDNDGQFSYEGTHFGSFLKLAHVRINVPGHGMSAITNFRRGLDLSNGLVTMSYQRKRTQYRREVFASHPDDVVVIRMRVTSGTDRLTGSVTVEGTRGETTSVYADSLCSGIQSTLGNGLAYAAVATARGVGGTVAISGSAVTFTNCKEVVIVVSGGTNYRPDPSIDFIDGTVDPLAIAIQRARTSVAVAGDRLQATHTADYRTLYDTMTVNLGTSTATQRSYDTWTRLSVRASDGGTPDPELEASYLQFGRYLTITGSRDWLPMNLQGLWLETNNPAWFSDYHTDINIQMNYWLADRAGLSPCFEVLADYCLSQLPYWSDATQRLFNDPRNRFRNSSGKIAGWTVAYSTNIYGGNGWWWHPGGNAWLCQTLWEHYEYTQNRDFLGKIYPLLKGAAEFWQARLITTTVTGPDGQPREVLVDDRDWSPEHGPQDALGITYCQEGAWMLFDYTRKAAALLGVDASFANDLGALQAKLYLPVVSPKTGWLEEWMSPDNLGETTHRHLSPLIGFFPGDRINTDESSAELIEGVRNLLVARGMESFGWACAWRSACWARLKNAENAYKLLGTVMKPSIDLKNGSAPNFFDMYSLGDRTIFQIEANLGATAAMLEMVLYSRPGVIELLPALPSAWAKSGQISGIGARGGFVVDVAWRNGKVTTVTVRSVGGSETRLRAGAWSTQVKLAPGQSATYRPA